MKRKKGHGFFCRCEYCKSKRIHSKFYAWILIAIAIILYYQAFLLVLFTTRFNALILLFFISCFMMGLFRIMF